MAEVREGRELEEPGATLEGQERQPHLERGDHALVAHELVRHGDDRGERRREPALERDGGARRHLWLDAGASSTGSMLLAEAPLLEDLRRAIETGEISPRAAPFVPTSASHATFEAGGFEGCRAAWEEARR